MVKNAVKGKMAMFILTGPCLDTGENVDVLVEDVSSLTDCNTDACIENVFAVAS